MGTLTGSPPFSEPILPIEKAPPDRGLFPRGAPTIATEKRKKRGAPYKYGNEVQAVASFVWYDKRKAKPGKTGVRMLIHPPTKDIQLHPPPPFIHRYEYKDGRHPAYNVRGSCLLGVFTSYPGTNREQPFVVLSWDQSSKACPPQTHTDRLSCLEGPRGWDIMWVERPISTQAFYDCKRGGDRLRIIQYAISGVHLTALREGVPNGEWIAHRLSPPRRHAAAIRVLEPAHLQTFIPLR